jgi:hypothetical protein
MNKFRIYTIVAVFILATGCESDKNDINLNDKTIAVTDVELSLTSLMLEESETKTLEHVILPENATNKEVIWASSHPEIAAVNSKGELEALNAGKCVITVTTKDGNRKATCNVTVIYIEGNHPIEEGVYTGTFTVTYFIDMPESWGRGSGETMLGLKNGKYSNTGNPNMIPAGGSGTYSISGNKIVFNDENGWLANFDGNLTLHGEYTYTFDGTRLKISAIKNNVGHYEYNLEKKDEYGNATVLGRGLDCGDIFLIRFDADVQDLPFSIMLTSNTYYAINLPEEYKIEGIRVSVQFRLPKDDEFIACTAMGPAYPAVFIVSAK